MKVFIVTGYNGILQGAGPAGVSTTKEGAERIQKEKEYMLDDSRIDEYEVQED